MKLPVNVLAGWALIACPLLLAQESFKPIRFASPEPGFKWEGISDVVASGDGVGGVLFLTDESKKNIVAKFEGSDAAAIVYADQFLKFFKIPATEASMLPIAKMGSGAGSRGPEYLERIHTAAVAKVGDQDAGGRLAKVVETSRHASALLLMKSIKRGGSGNINGILERSAGDSPDVEGAEFYLKALADPKQAKLLGKLFALDTFLGNGDRFQDGTINAGNLMVDDKSDFVAIDNLADFSTPREYAYWMAVSATLGQSLKNGGTNEEQVSLDSTKWQRGLIEGFLRNGIRTPKLDRVVNDKDSEAIVLWFANSTSTMIQNLERSPKVTTAKKANLKTLRLKIDWKVFATAFNEGKAECCSKLVKMGSSPITGGLTRQAETVFKIKKTYLNHRLAPNPLDHNQALAALELEFGKAYSRDGGKPTYDFKISYTRDANLEIVILGEAKTASGTPSGRKSSIQTGR